MRRLHDYFGPMGLYTAVIPSPFERNEKDQGVALDTKVSAPESDVSTALLRWRTGEGTTLLILYGSLIVVLFPAFHYLTRLLPGHVPDFMPARLISALLSLALVIGVIFVHSWRPIAYRLQLANVALFFVVLMFVLVRSGNLNWYLTGVMIALFGAQYAFLRWQDLVAAYAVGFGFEAAYSAYLGIFTRPVNLYTLGVVLFCSVVCIATGLLRLRALHAQTRNRVALELQAQELRQQSERVAHLAYSDGLTGLVNRSGLYDRIDRTLAIADRHGLRVALLYLDLDGFKEVNDRFGHDVGDSVLVEASLRIQFLLRHGETLARVGGDEFVVLMPVITSPDEPARLSERIEDAFRDPFYAYAGNGLSMGTSIGYAIYPTDGASRLELLAYADSRMYEVKRRRSQFKGRVAPT